MGGVDGDAVREIAGWLRTTRATNGAPDHNGVFVSVSNAVAGVGGGGSTVMYSYRGNFSASAVVPTGPVNAPRRWGALACVYLGQPAS